MKQYFDSKVKLGNEDEVAAGSMIMKTDQGLEFVVSSKKKQTDSAQDLTENN